jgi:hypothetical protein
VNQESPASQPLHHLQSELLAAKAAWERLGVRIGLGYTEAYQRHFITLAEMKRAHDAAMSNDVAQFVLSVVSVGFAGGLVGSLIGPWIRGAGKAAAQKAFRDGITGIGQQAAKDVAKAGARKFMEKPQGADDPFTTSAASEIATDQFIRDSIGSAFGPVLEALDAMIAEANRVQASAGVGQEILNRFRMNCPLLRDKPAEADVPSKVDAARAAELSMWVAWANERSPRYWQYWNGIYQQLDRWSRAPVCTDPGGGQTGTPGDLRDAALQFDPIGRRMLALGKWGAVYDSVLLCWATDTKNNKGVLSPVSDETGWRHVGDSFLYVDLRKLRDLRLNDGNLPFRRFEGRIMWDKTKPLERVHFLSRLQNVPPVYKKYPALSALVGVDLG